MSTALLPYTLGRKEFRYRNELYTRTLQVADSAAESALDDAKKGIRPISIVEGLISSEYADEAAERLSRYSLAWDFYTGAHYDDPMQDGELKVIINYTKLVTDIAVNWFVADGWHSVCRSGNESVAELLDTVWDYNNRLQLTETLAHFGAVTGDAFVYVTFRTKNSKGRTLPKSEWKMVLNALNPAHCFPLWNPFIPGEMLAFLLQYPIPHPDDSSRVMLISLLIEEDIWTLWYDNDKVKEGVNAFGRINVVHIPNFVLANSCFGQSDIHQIIPINAEANDVMNVIRRVLHYHVEPTTLVFGAKVRDLEKGANKVWSGLPVDGRIENLEMQSDLKATYEYLQSLKDSIAQMSQTPKSLFSLDSFSLSNTSGLAMQMTFQPIIEKTKKRRITYRTGFRKINELIILGHERVLGMKVDLLADFPDVRYESDISFSSPLPRDEKSELDAAQMKLNMRVWSRAEAIRKLSEASDHTRLMLELAADDRYDLARAYELQRANNGMDPNLSVVFLNSSVLSEDFEDLAKKMPTEDESGNSGDFGQ